MQRIDGPYAVSTKPAPSPPATSPGYFSGGDPARGVKATRVTKDWLNRVQEEICNVIIDAGITLDRNDDTQLLQALKKLFGGGSGGPGGSGGLGADFPSGYLTEFRGFFEKTPPTGWAKRYGEILVAADLNYPRLWEALQKPANAWKCKTQTEWDAMRQANPFNGVGGVPFFVIDISAKTIRLPDTRGMYIEDSGFSGLEVGGVHGDAIRNITGTAPCGQNQAHWTPTGVFYGSPTSNHNGQSSNDTNNQLLMFDASRVVPVANVNRPKAFGILPCVYVGTAE